MDAPADPPFLRAEDAREASCGNYNGEGAMAIILDAQNRILLNLRDEKEDILYPAHWALIGGALEAGESPLDGLRREVEEEIGLKLGEVEPYCRVIDRDGVRHLLTIFVARTEIPLTQMCLREGTKLVFAEQSEIPSMKMTPFLKDVVERYIDEQRSS